jgi:hypothetical protein
LTRFKVIGTLVVLLVIVVVGFSVLITAGKGVGQYFFGKGFAEGQLRDYVASLQKTQVQGASCQVFDTDSNGYVSCDYTIANDPGKTYSIECAAWGLDGFLNKGCKTRIPQSGGNTR